MVLSIQPTSMKTNFPEMIVYYQDLELINNENTSATEPFQLYPYTTSLKDKHLTCVLLRGGRHPGYFLLIDNENTSDHMQ